MITTQQSPELSADRLKTIRKHSCRLRATQLGEGEHTRLIPFPKSFPEPKPYSYMSDLIPMRSQVKILLSESKKEKHDNIPWMKTEVCNGSLSVELPGRIKFQGGQGFCRRGVSYFQSWTFVRSRAEWSRLAQKAAKRVPPQRMHQPLLPTQRVSYLEWLPPA